MIFWMLDVVCLQFTCLFSSFACFVSFCFVLLGWSWSCCCLPARICPLMRRPVSAPWQLKIEGSGSHLICIPETPRSIDSCASRTCHDGHRWTMKIAVCPTIALHFFTVTPYSCSTSIAVHCIAVHCIAWTDTRHMPLCPQLWCKGPVPVLGWHFINYSIMFSTALRCQYHIDILHTCIQPHTNIWTYGHTCAQAYMQTWQNMQTCIHAYQ